MKKVILLTLAGLSLVAWAALSPVRFDVPKNATKQALADLISDQDPAALAMEREFPGFGPNFIKLVTKFSRVALESLIVPMSMSIKEEDHDVQYAFGKAVKNLQIFVEGNVSTEYASQNYSELGYRYCEKYPEFADDVCSPYEQPVIDVLLRRTLSNAVFIRQMCPVVTQFLVWTMIWNDATRDYSLDYAKFFTELEKSFRHYYNNGRWSHQVLFRDPSQVRRDISYHIGRRYLDGGPPAMLEAANCVKGVLTQYQSTVPKTDPQTTTLMNVFKFKAVELSSGEKIEISQAQSADELYRVAHHMSPSQDLPEDIHNYGWLDYLGTLNGSTADAAFRTSNVATALDPVFRYRLLTWNEFVDLVEMGEIAIARDQSYCLAAKNYLTEGRENLSFVNYEGDYGASGSDRCTAAGFWLVRGGR